MRLPSAEQARHRARERPRLARRSIGPAGSGPALDKPATSCGLKISRLYGVSNCELDGKSDRLWKKRNGLRSGSTRIAPSVEHAVDLVVNLSAGFAALIAAH